VRAATGCRGASPVVARHLTDKGAQRARWTAAGLPCPTWGLATTVEDVVALVAELGGELIVKPVDSAGSRGVVRIDAPEHAAAAARVALAASPSGTAIVERFVHGTEMTVETFGADGEHVALAVTSKRKVPGSGGTVAMELATPDLPFDEVDAVARLAAAALNALGYDDGPGHTEILRADDGTLTLVEAAGRGGGFMVADGLVPAASGIDLAAVTVRQALGLPFDAAPTQRLAVVLRFVPSTAGVVRTLGGFEAARRLDGVDAGPLVEVGAVVGDARADGDRLAYVLTSGATVADALDRADAAEAALTIVIDPAARACG
jgi:biotin carboxylase